MFIPKAQQLAPVASISSVYFEGEVGESVMNILLRPKLLVLKPRKGYTDISFRFTRLDSFYKRVALNLTLIILVRLGIPDLASNTEVFAVSSPSLSGMAETTMSDGNPQSPFETDTSHCPFPSVSSLGTVAFSLRADEDNPQFSANSAISTELTGSMSILWLLGNNSVMA